MMNSSGPERIRAFIAIPIGSDLRKAIVILQQALARSIPEGVVRWTAPEQIHLTLKFFGDIPARLLPDIEVVLSSLCARHASLELTAGSLGCFPNERDPRVLWIGLADGVNPLKTLVKQLDERLTPWIAPEAREFHPHLTLGRIKYASAAARQALRAAMQMHVEDCLASWRADRVELLRSELTPNGSRYTVLQTWPLGT
jgi:2'-5' RNA ligase